MLHDAGNDISRSRRAACRAHNPVDGRGFQATSQRPDPQHARTSRPWRSAASSATATSTPSSAPVAPTCARWPRLSRGAYFARHAAREQNYGGLKWPSQYRRAGEIRLRGRRTASFLSPCCPSCPRHSPSRERVTDMNQLGGGFWTCAQIFQRKLEGFRGHSHERRASQICPTIISPGSHQFPVTVSP